MEFKKTIAAVALSASSVFALIGPGGQSKTICLNSHSDADGVQYVGSCDQSINNKKLNVELLANGCTQKQAAMRVHGFGGKFSVKINPCLPPNIVQL